MINLYDTANQLESELRQVPEYLAIKEAFAKVKADEAANAIYMEYRSVQEEMHAKMMTGAMPGEDDKAKLQEVGQKVEANEVIRVLLDAEMKFSALVQEMNRIIMRPIQEIYDER
jgi:cell fate (sporulation/competence/biofilm development) regulator YlbF (YheA/YmcA/DUF963 family)